MFLISCSLKKSADTQIRNKNSNLGKCYFQNKRYVLNNL